MRHEIGTYKFKDFALIAEYINKENDKHDLIFNIRLKSSFSTKCSMASVRCFDVENNDSYLVGDVILYIKTLLNDIVKNLTDDEINNIISDLKTKKMPISQDLLEMQKQGWNIDSFLIPFVE